MQVTDELRVLVEAEVARAIENFKKLSDGINDSEKKSSSLGEALDSLSNKSLIVSGVLGGAAVAAVKFAGENEKLKLSLKNMLDSAEEATSVFEDWRKLGASPGLNVDEVFSLGKAMVNMGQSTEYATSTIDMLGNISAGTSASFGEISTAFERARAMGNLTTRDLVRLQQQGIPIVKELAKVMGISEESVRQLAEKGKIGFNDLERAFKSMTGPGGQFAGMMDELSGTVLEKFSTATDDAKQALAAFGEVMLPFATELLDSASSIFKGISEMDEGTKRFLVGMGGVIAISGPAIKAIKGINAAIAMLSANPAILVAGGIAAAFAGIIYIVNDFSSKMDKSAKDYDKALKDISQSNKNLVQNGSFEEASQKIRGLTKGIYDAAREAGDFDAAIAASEKLTRLSAELNKISRQNIESAERLKVQAQSVIKTLETPINPDTDPSNYWANILDGFASEEQRFEEAIKNVREGSSELYAYLHHGNKSWAEAVESQSADAMLAVLKNIGDITPAAKTEIEKLHKEIAELGSGSTIRPKVNVTPVFTTNKKTWQEWFGDITKVDPALFGNSGAKAAQLYLDGFERTVTAQSTIARALGENFNVAEQLKSQQADVQKTLIEMFSIDPTQINNSFTLADNSVKELIKSYEELGKKAKDAENAMFNKNTLEELSEAVRTLGKDQYDLTLEKMETANATAQEIEQAEKLIETLRTTGMSIEGLIARKVSNGLLNIFPEMEKQAAQAIGNISAQLSMISFDSMLNGLSAIGEGFAMGLSAAENLEQAMSQMAQQILNQLPNMFLQAGLQLIAQGQWPLGLGFIAAAGSTALISGYVKGTIDKKTEEANANAQGNAFDTSGVLPYAHGGSFTNQIVSTPTYFAHGGGFGLMGEAGPEAIMPLTRMTDGKLGVQTSGTGSNVEVHIHNHSGEPVSQEETENADGTRQLEITIGNAVDKYFSSGKSDRVMASRYGLRHVGV